MTKIPRLDATLCFVNEDRIELETANEEDQNMKSCRTSVIKNKFEYDM